MTTPSSFSEIGLSINYSDPLWKLGRVGFLGTLANQVDSYDQEITAVGGYWSASFSIKGRQRQIEDWFAKGLGRHIEVYNPALDKIWEGFVNRVSIKIGGLSVERGELVAIGNRIYAVYAPIDTTTTPPVTAIRTQTAVANDTDSQNLYSIIQKNLDAGKETAAGAEQIRDTYLKENRWPETNQSLSLGGGAANDISVSIECAGYVKFLETFTYTEATSGTWTLREKLLDALAGDPNALISTDYSQIAANSFTVDRYEDNSPTAWAVIKSLLAYGDTSDNRYIFGIYNDRRAYYSAIPTAEEYVHRLADPAQSVQTVVGGTVKPWDVKPGKWLFIPDFLIGQSQASDLRQDPRYMFIESARYSAPWKLDLKGGKTDKLSQKLAKLGLGGL